MRKIFLIIIVLCGASLALAAPDPRDSIIVESKSLPRTLGGCSSGLYTVRVWITNKDSLNAIHLPLETNRISGTAHATLARSSDCTSPRTFDDVFNVLLSPGQLPLRTADFSRYNDSSPDSFWANLGADLNSDSTKVPPHLTRSPLLDIKFDVTYGGGQFQIDSARIAQTPAIQFVDAEGSQVKVNFLKGILSRGVTNPQDSIIFESKTIVPQSGPCASAVLKVRVYITNRDSLTGVVLPFETKSISGSAYATLSRPANCGNRLLHHFFDFLYPPSPSGGPRLPSRQATMFKYNSTSPDTTYLVLLGLIINPDEKIPPNLTRTLLGELKFDTILTNIGEFEINNVTTSGASSGASFYGPDGSTLFPNLVKGVISVTCNVPPPAPVLNCPSSPQNAFRGQPFSFNFTSSAAKPYFSIVQGPGNIDPAFGLYSLPDLCPSGPVSVRVRVIDSVGSTCFSPPVFCDFSFVVGNNTPFVTNCPDSIFSTSPGVPFSLQLTAADPDVVDKDSLTFSLSTGPPGLSVSPSGLVQWTPSPEESGAFYACVSVSDPCGASSKCCLNFNGRKGDLNLDGILNSQDVVLMLNCVFLGIDPPAGQPGCDVNCSGVATPLDVIYQINAIFGFWSYPCP